MKVVKWFVLLVVLFCSMTLSVSAQDKGSMSGELLDEMALSEEEMESGMKALKNKMDVMGDEVEETVDDVMDMLKDGDDSAEMAEATPYSIDVGHSTLGFAVKHLGVGTTRGSFGVYDGTIYFDPDNYDSFTAEVTIDAASIDTKLKKRDDHLRAADFFDVENYPEITFESTRLEKRGEGAVIIGDLTMKGVTKQLTIPVQISGPVKSPFGQTVIALAARITINRQDYGISWSKTLDNGGLVVDDNVDLIIELEAQNNG